MDVIVIGGGMGGLSAAIGLAGRGARVTLLEKNARLGGKLNKWKQDGFTFDTGPHVLTMRWAIDEVFASAGRGLEDLPRSCRWTPSAVITFQAATCWMSQPTLRPLPTP